MNSRVYSRPWLGTLCLLDAVGLGWAGLMLLRVSGGSGRAVLLGLSASSLALLGLVSLMALGLLTAGLLTLQGKPLLEKLISRLLRRPALSLGLLATGALASWLIVWTPAERFGGAYYYALRLIPLAAWLAFAGGTLALFVLVTWLGVDKLNGREYLRQNRALFVVSAITLAVIALLAWLAAQRIVGMDPQEEDFWYGAGVPVLAWQVLTAILIGWGAAWGERKFLHSEEQAKARRVPVDVLVFLIIWIAAGFLWARMPIASNFMVSQPYPPNFEYYPAADGENYDLASQYALIGQGLFDGGRMRVYFERPLYSAFLFYLHLLVGQDFARLLALQAALYAVFPALAYLIGKQIHSRGLGAALAALLTMRGINGLATGAILENATQKMFLTEFPTAIGLALILLLTLRWAQQPQSRWRLAGWLGGCISLGSFVRPHLAFFLPAGLVLAFGLYPRRKRLGAALAGWMILAYLAAVLPWMQFNGSGDSLIGMYLWRAQAIINERFHWPAPGDSALPWQVASLSTLPVRFDPLPLKTLPAFASDHFLNNLALSAFTLPSTLRNLDLITLIKKSETFWKPYWDGALSPAARVLLPLNLALIALGIGLAWRRARLRGLIPLLGMLLYFLINSLVRTSGGRYLVPADWILLLYYLLGWAALYEIGAAWLGERILPDDARREAELQPDNKKRALQGLVVLAVLFGIGCAIPLAGWHSHRRYELLDKFQTAKKIDAGQLAQFGIGAAELQAFLAQDQAVALEGRALYPRYIWRSVNPLIPGHLLETTLYPRMTFIVISAGGRMPVILDAGEEWFPFPQAADVIVLGCQEYEFLDAWAVFLPELGVAYLRQPETPLRCPLPEPICDQNGWCK